MIQGASKRNASRSPDGERAHKRMVTSSPEEGEVDDSTPLPEPPILLPPSLPPKPQIPNRRAPVAFPFKKKFETVKPPVTNGPNEPKDGNVIYDRPHGEEPRNRPGDYRPRGARGPAPDYRESSRGESLLSRIGPRQDPREDRYRPSSPPNSRSRSPGSRSPAPQHRLPTRRSPESTFSPPSRDHRHDYARDRDRGGYDRRDGDSYRPRGREDYDDRYYDRDRGRYDSGSTNESDRHHRSNNPYPHRREDDRAWTRRDDDWRRREEPRRYRDDHRYEREDYDWPRRQDSYRPPSPPPRRSPSPSRTPSYAPRSPSPPRGPLSPAPPAPLPPATESKPPSTTPPPPASSPPPAPPPDARLVKSSTLPPAHNHVSITLKRPDAPPAPRNAHSPTPLPLPPVKNDINRHPDEKKDIAKLKQPLRKREVRVRSKKQELQALGRVFKGCGSQSDYNVTTKLGEGTFGEVHKAIHKETGDHVALKRILMHNEKDGMPVTALREIKILKALNHPNIIEIRDMFVLRSNAKDPLSVYMVFPYMDHDLAGLLENDRVKLQPSHIKLYMKQLLEGTEYMHRNHILHRDMKAANLLISNSGSLRIADFGLARAFDGAVNDSKPRKYTNCVVTRWYRPPELLLGARQYGGEIDIWGIGCVLGEMFTRRPILPGNSDLDQLDKIWQLCGTPNQHTWPNHDNLPGCEGIKRFSQYPRKLKQVYESVGAETCDLLDKLLTCNPSQRITAAEALEHDYFWTDPLPADPKTLPSYEPSHEFDKRGHRGHHPPQQQPPMPHPMPHQMPPGPHGPHFDNRPPPRHHDQHNRHGGGGPPRGRYQHHHHHHRGPPGPPPMPPTDPNSSLPPRPSGPLPPMPPNQYRGPPRHGQGHGPGRDDSWGARPPGLPQRPAAPQGYAPRNSNVPARPGPPMHDGPLNYG